jgi:uncharacterized protein YqjF (DUF2071 family)
VADRDISDRSPPRRGRFLTAVWRNLVMLNYEIEPAALRRWLPTGTELDYLGDRLLVSVVGFQFLGTRVLGVRVPFHGDFDEVNLRFYVRRKRPDGWRRGVVFVREIVPRRAVTFFARTLYGENYVTLPMRHRLDLNGATLRRDGAARYEWWHGGAWNALLARTTGAATDPPRGSEEEFVTKHFWGYTRRGNATWEYRVEHPLWRVWRTTQARLECDPRALYGPEFAAALSAPPASALVADGSDVTVYRGARI